MYHPDVFLAWKEETRLKYSQLSLFLLESSYRYISTPQVELKPTIPVFLYAIRTCTLDPAVTTVGCITEFFLFNLHHSAA